MKKDRAEYLGTLLDNLRIACHLSFHVHLIYARMTFNSPNSDKLLTHATFYPRVNSPTSRTCRSSSSMRKTLLSVFITIYNTYALFRNANIVFNFLSSVGHHFFFSLTLALSTGKKTICLLNNTRYYWVTAVTKTKNLITRTTGRSVQLLWPAN